MNLATKTLLSMGLGVLCGMPYNSFALEPGHPERKYKAQDMHCFNVGKFFGEVAIQKRQGVSAQTILSQAKGDMVIPAIELIYQNEKNVPPQLAAWYGYGYCMAFMANDMKEKV